MIILGFMSGVEWFTIISIVGKLAVKGAFEAGFNEEKVVRPLFLRACRAAASVRFQSQSGPAISLLNSGAWARRPKRGQCPPPDVGAVSMPVLL